MAGWDNSETISDSENPSEIGTKINSKEVPHDITDPTQDSRIPFELSRAKNAFGAPADPLGNSTIVRFT